PRLIRERFGEGCTSLDGANLLLDNGSDLARVLFARSLVFALDHHSKLIFGPRISNENSAAITKLFRFLRDDIADSINRIEVRLTPYPHVHELLRKLHEALGEFGERLPSAAHHLHHLNRRE